MLDDDITVRVGSRTVVATVLGPQRGKPVLLFHGAPGCRLQALRLSEGAARSNVRLIALDRPGCGRTSPVARPASWADQVVADATAVLDELEIRTVAALALSGGVAAALVTANAQRERIERVAFASGLGLVERREYRRDLGTPNKVLWAAARRSVPAVKLSLAPAYLMSRLSAALPPPSDPRLASLARESRETFRQGIHGPAIDISAASHVDRIDLATVHQPVVAWHGSHDRHAPLEGMRALVNQLRDASLHVVQGGDHFIFESKAEEILVHLRSAS